MVPFDRQTIGDASTSHFALAILYSWFKIF